MDVQSKIRSETPRAGLPPDFSGRRPRFLRSAALFPVVGSVEVSGRFIDRLTKAQNGPKSNPQNTWGVVRPFSGTLRLAGRGVFCASPLSHSPPLNTLPAGKEQDTLRSEPAGNQVLGNSQERMSKTMNIGIDHDYYAIKTRHFFSQPVSPPIPMSPTSNRQKSHLSILRNLSLQRAK